MKITAKISATIAALTLATAAIAGCTATATTPQAAEPTVTADARQSAQSSPTPTYLTELPAWATEEEGYLYLIYPEDMKCKGTEGCPNDFVSLFGEPGPVLPKGVEYYDPAKHDCVFVFPEGRDCSG